MNVTTLKRALPRLEIAEDKFKDILRFGVDNLQPQKTRGICMSSESATQCIRRYIKFIRGNGFNSDDFGTLIVNSIGDNANDILRLIVNDLAYFGGFAIHVNYDLNFKISEIFHVPFEHCRLSIPDDSGYIGRIAVSSDWEKQSIYSLIDDGKVKFIYSFNPNENVIKSQIESDGGIDSYKGQILWASTRGRNEYPVPIYDSVLTYCSIQEGLSNVLLRNVRNNFLSAGILVTQASDNSNLKDEDNYLIDSNSDNLTTQLSNLANDMSACTILSMEVSDLNTEMPKFIPFSGTNYDKEYEFTSETAEGKIYKAFSQEAWLRVANGSLGFSTDISKQAYDEYNSFVEDERQFIETNLSKIFNIWHGDSNYDLTIKPLIYIITDTNINSENNGNIGPNPTTENTKIPNNG